MERCSLNGGSKKVKLPTIWHGQMEKQRWEKRREEKKKEDQRRERVRGRVRGKKMHVREKVEKSRNTVFFQ